MFFSIIVPIFNREHLIARCMRSVLDQDCGDFELIAIDDGSTDQSLTRLREFDDPRIRVVAQKMNRGVGSARNRGVDESRGDWIVFLDSDDELVPGALAHMRDMAAAVPADVHSLWFRCRMDDGRICPERVRTTRDWDYESFVGFLEETVGEWRDMIRCSRRACCELVRYPENRSDADKYLHDFARQFRIRAYPEVLRLYHQDAPNQLTRFHARLDPERDRQIVRDRADGFASLLDKHGQFIRYSAPRLYAEYLQSAVATAIMAGRRTTALGYALRLVWWAPGLRRAWLLLGASLVGPRAVSLRRRMSRART